MKLVIIVIVGRIHVPEVTDSARSVTRGPDAVRSRRHQGSRGANVSPRTARSGTMNRSHWGFA